MMNSDDDAITRLCPACGLCCNGVIFANLALQPADDPARLQFLGIPVRRPHSALRPAHLAQPCAAFDGSRCRIYADRPQYCRQFECVLLKSVMADRTEPAVALRVIGTARTRADKVRSLLSALGDTDTHLPLSRRFRRIAKRLQNRELDDVTSETYAELTLAVQDLNLLLADAFYPGDTCRAQNSPTGRLAKALACAAALLFAAVRPLSADQVQLTNGDRYIGQVLSLNTNTVVLQSDVLGTVRLPRAKVASITLEPSPTTNSPALPRPANPPPRARPTARTNSAAGLSPALRQLAASTNLVQQVQQQFLGDAGPEANARFNELLGGLLNGTLTVDDIRAQAKEAADQLRALQRESGEDAGFAAGAYLSILDHFLKDTAPAAPATNAPAPPSGSKTAPGRQAK